MGSKGGSTTNTTNQPPKEVMEMYKYITSQGKELQQKPYEGYSGQLVAPLNPIQEQSIAQVQNSSQAASPYLQGAGASTAAAGYGYTPQGFQQGVGQYMSPYMQNVVQGTMANLAENQAQQRNYLTNKLISGGAFGGDRGGVMAAELARQQQLATGKTIGDLLQGGYTQAADLYNKGLAGQLTSAAQFGDIGTKLQGSQLSGAEALGKAGSVPYSIAQAQNAANYQQFAQQQAYPFQSLGFLANIASGLGGGMGGSSSTTTPGPSALGQILGGLTTLGSLFQFSDKRMKDDVEKIGETFDGQPIYSFKYKGEDKTNIGLMAQDVEKKHPEAVKNVGGLKAVNYEAATRGAADRGHFAEGGASQGGLVPAGMERMAFARGGIGLTPYIDDPLYEFMGANAKVPFISYIPALDIKGSGGSSKIPTAPEYEDKPSEWVKGIQAMPEWQKANLKSNLKNFLDPKSYSLGDNYWVTESGDVRRFAEGGLVPRTAHADGEPAPMGDDQTVPADRKMNVFEHILGRPLSDEARSGMLAAGLGMLASRSPFASVAVGEGALGGLNTYYNAIKNKMEQTKTAFDINKGQQEIDIRRGELGVSQRQVAIKELENKIAILNMLRARAAGYLATPGGTIPPDLQSDIDALMRDTGVLRSAINVGTATPPSMSSSGLAGGVTAAPEQGGLVPPVVTAPSKPPATTTAETTAPVVKSETATAPAPTTTTTPPVTTEKPVVEVAPTETKASTGFKLPPSMDPEVLEADAARIAQLGFGEQAAEKIKRATELRTAIGRDGGLYINGQFVPLPDYAEQIAAREAKKTKAQKEEESKFELVDVMQPDGTVIQMPKSEALKSGQVIKSIPAATLEAQKLTATENSKRSVEAGQFLSELPAVNQIQNGLINAYTKIDMNRATPLQADIIGTIKSFPALDNTLKSMGIDVDKNGFQGMADAAAKDAITDAFNRLSSNAASRTTNMQLKETLLSVADTPKAPAARYQVIVQQQAMIMAEEEKYRAWNKVAGKESWSQFIDKWTSNPEHSIEHYMQKATDKVPYFKGMTEADINNLEYKRGGESAQKPSAPKKIVRSGKVLEGPNAGKTVIEYSDGTREYQ